MARTPPPTAVPVATPWPAIVALAFAVGLLLWSQSLGPVARRFPQAVAAILAVLAAFDLWSRARLPGRDAVVAIWGASFANREMTHSPRLRDELAMAGWVLTAFAGMAALGILVALPVFCAAFIRLRGGRSFAAALVAALALAGFTYTIFEVLLDYELYRGLILSGGGFRRW